MAFMAKQSSAAEQPQSRTLRLRTAEPFDDPNRPLTVEITLDLTTERATHVSIGCQSGLTAAELKGMPFSDWFFHADWILRRPELGSDDVIELEDVSVTLPGAPLIDVRHPGRGGRGARHYQNVATRYKELLEQHPKNPTARLGALYGVSRHTAAGWVRQARELGYLPPGHQGRAG
jgi:hypothetical protein